MKMPKFLAKLLAVVLVATNIQTVKSSAQQVDSKSTIKREESVMGSKNLEKSDQGKEKTDDVGKLESELQKFLLLHLPKSFDDENFTDKDELLKNVSKAKELIKKLQFAGVKNETIEGYANYAGIGFALGKVDRILLEYDYIFGFIREEDNSGNYADVTLEDNNTINMKVLKNERMGEIFDGHHLVEYILNYGSPAPMQADKFNIAGITITPEPSGSDPGIGITSVVGKRNLLYAFTKLSEKTYVCGCKEITNPITSTYLYDLVGTSFTTTYKGKTYTIKFTADNAKKEMITREIKSFENLDKDYYTSSSFKKLSEAIEVGKKVVNNEDSTQEKIDEIYKNIIDAKNNLVPAKTYTLETLKAFIEDVKGMDKSSYPTSLLNTVLETLEEAKAVANKNDSTEEEITKITTKLTMDVKNCENGKRKIQKLRDVLKTLPANDEESKKIKNKTEAEKLLKNYIEAELEARTIGISDGDISAIQREYGDRQKIIDKRVADMNEGYQVVDQIRYLLDMDYSINSDNINSPILISDKDIDLSTNEIIINVADGSKTLRETMVSGGITSRFQSDTKKAFIMLNKLEINGISMSGIYTGINSTSDNSTKKKIREAIQKYTGINDYEKITLGDLKNKECKVTFGKQVYTIKFKYAIDESVLKEQYFLAQTDQYQKTDYFKTTYDATLLKTLNNTVKIVGELMDGHFNGTAEGEKQEIAESLYKAMSECRTWNNQFKTLSIGLLDLPNDEELENLLPRASVRTELTNKTKVINSAIEKLKKIGVSDDMINQISNYDRLTKTEARNEVLKSLVFANPTLAKLPKDEDAAYELFTDAQIATLRNNLKASQDKIAELRGTGISKKDTCNMLDYYRIAISLERLADEDDMLNALKVYSLIKELPEKITLNEKEKIELIRNTYENLSEEEKSYVSEETLDKIVKAESDLENSKLKDIELLNIEELLSTDKVIKGKTIEGATIKAYVGDIQIGETVKASKNGDFEIPISKQSSKIIIKIVATKDGYNDKSTEIKVVQGIDIFETELTVDSIKATSDKISGRGQVGATIKAYVNEKQIGKSVLVKEDGTYSISIPRQNPLTEIKVEMSMENTHSVYKKIKVDELQNIDKLSVKEVLSTSTTIKGTTIEGATVKAYVGKTQIGKTCKSNQKGDFTISIPKQRGNTKIKIIATKDGYKEKSKEIKVSKVVYNFTKELTMSLVSPTSTKITGKGQSGATIKAYVDGKQIGKSAKVNSKGNYTIYIPKQKKYSKVTVKMSKENYNTVSKSKTVLNIFSKNLILNTINIKSKKISGKGQSGATIKAYVKGKQIGKSVKVKADGTFSITIPKQKSKTIIDLKMSKKGYTTVCESKKVLKLFSKALKVNSVSRSSTKITGSCQRGARVKAYVNGKQIVKTAVVDNKGNYKIYISPQKKGTKITIKMSKTDYKTVSKVVIVK